MECPYCHNDNMPTPSKTKTFRPYNKCPDCGKKSRAAISYGADGTIYVHYSATSRPRLGPDEVKDTYSIRLSQRDLLDIENGRKYIAVCNNGLRLQYIH